MDQMQVTVKRHTVLLSYESRITQSESNKSRLSFQRRIQEFAKGGRSLPPLLLSHPPFSPLTLPVRNKATLTGKRVWGSAVSSLSGVRGVAPAEKIWCTLKLSESHWWQSF